MKILMSVSIIDEIAEDRNPTWYKHKVIRKESQIVVKRWALLDESFLTYCKNIDFFFSIVSLWKDWDIAVLLVRAE